MGIPRHVSNTCGYQQNAELKDNTLKNNDFKRTWIRGDHPRRASCRRWRHGRCCRGLYLVSSHGGPLAPALFLGRAHLIHRSFIVYARKTVANGDKQLCIAYWQVSCS